MPIRGRVRGIDPCIAHIVAALNAANVTTVASCCGHGHRPGIISLEDGRELIVAQSRDESERLTAGYPDINGERCDDPCGDGAGAVSQSRTFPAPP
jgi:hypothetical protein